MIKGTSSALYVLKNGPRKRDFLGQASHLCLHLPILIRLKFSMAQETTRCTNTWTSSVLGLGVTVLKVVFRFTLEMISIEEAVAEPVATTTKYSATIPISYASSLRFGVSDEY